MKISELDARVDKARKKVKGREDFKVASGVFDRSTLLTLYYLANKGVIEILRGTIKTGKESSVFLAEKDEEAIAVKIHRITASDYRNMLKYIEGDYRFRGIKKSRRSVVYVWVQKEFKNLRTALEAGVRVPKPISYKNNVLVMEFIGEEKIAYPMLSKVKLKNPDKVLARVVEDMQKLYCKAKLVHSDLSEYNILMKDEIPIIIDLSHAVVREHPLAGEYLERDVANIARFFHAEPSRIMKQVTGCKNGIR